MSLEDSSKPNPLSLNSDGHLMCFEGADSEVEIFTRFYVATRPSLRAYLATMLFDEAACEDCIQEATLVLWKKRDPNWNLEDFRKLAFTCAKFKALSWLKKHKPKQHLNLSPELAEKLAQKAAETEHLTATSQLDRLQALRMCVENLPDNQRDMIKLRYQANNAGSLAKLAKKLNCKMPAIYKQMERTRAALRQCIERKVKSI